MVSTGWHPTILSSPGATSTAMLPAFHCGLMSALNPHKLPPLRACSAFMGTGSLVGPAQCVSSSTCKHPSCRLHTLLSTCTLQACSSHRSRASGAAGGPPGSCSTACVPPNGSTLLHIHAGERPITNEYYFPSSSLCCNTLLERQSPRDTSADIAHSAPCILCSSSPACPI